MKRHIHLRDLDHLEVPDRHDPKYSKELVAKARAKFIHRDLRFDNNTGSVRDNQLGLLSRLVRASDHVPAASEEEVFEYQFLPFIYNESQRLYHGYDD